MLVSSGECLTVYNCKNPGTFWNNMTHIIGKGYTQPKEKCRYTVMRIEIHSKIRPNLQRIYTICLDHVMGEYSKVGTPEKQKIKKQLPSFLGGGGLTGAGVYGELTNPAIGALGAYHGFVLGQACPLSNPSLSYIIPWAPRGFFWFSEARLRRTRFIEETYKQINIFIFSYF